VTFGHIGVAHWPKHTWRQHWVASAVLPKGKGNNNDDNHNNLTYKVSVCRGILVA